jgi:hypothetical protein
MPGYHTKKDGTKAKKGLYYNMNKKKAAGTSNSKAKSTDLLFLIYILDAN